MSYKLIFQDNYSDTNEYEECSKMFETREEAIDYADDNNYEDYKIIEG